MRLIYHTCLYFFLVACFSNVVASQNLDNAGLPSTSAAGAYSLRLLSSTYTGPLVRITIGSNYYDVYPDTITHVFSLSSKISVPLSTYDAAVSAPTNFTLRTIIPSMTATVAIWYDQSSSNNAVQSVTLNQPRIINSGVIETTNSLPTIRYLGNAFLVVTSTVFNNDLSGTVVFNATSANTSSGGAGSWYNMNGIFGSEQSSAINDFAYGVYNGKFTAGSGSSDNSLAGSVTVNNSTTRIHSWTRNNTSGAVNLYANGASDGTMTLNTGSRTDVPSVAIGANQTFSSGQVFYTGTISEMILIASIYSTTNRNAVENNQSNYYSTSVTTNANLTALTISNGTLSPVFATNTTTYTANVPNSTANVTVTPTKSDANATIQVRLNGGGYSTLISGSASSSLSLNEGSNMINVKVTSSDGTSIKTYTIIVTRATASSTNAALFDLTTSAGALTPAFNANILTYNTPNVSNTTSSVTITPTKSDANSTIQVRLNSGSFSNITSGSTSENLNLDEGSNTIDVQVTAQDGTTIKTYTITIIRAAASATNADLSNLTISSGTLSPNFTVNTRTYSASVSNATTSITVTPTKLDLNSTIQVRINEGSYADVTSGTASSDLPLNIGTNTIDIRVTAQDGTTRTTYSIYVCRLPTANISSTNGPICAGNNAVFNITGTSGATLTYNINNGSNITTILTGGMATITIPSASGNQILNFVSITDGTCTQSLSENAALIVNASPTPSVTGSLSGCTIVNLTASGGITYAWSGGSTPSTAANTFTTSGNYTVTVTDSNGCLASTTSNITVNTPASVVYVNGAVSTSGDGRSWANAFKTLQEALTSCTQQIWVEAGTYKPSAYPTGCTSCSTARDYTFHLVNGVKLYGGFAGTETLLSQRNYANNVTILSGDLSGDDVITGSGATLTFSNNTENVYHVVLSVSDSSTTVLDGFTITGGAATTGGIITVETKSINRNFGGGIFNISSSPSLSNIIVTGNSAITSGGGIYNNTSSTPTIANSTFKLNKASNGGGIYNNNTSSPIISKSIFNGNLATTNGGGMYDLNTSSPTVTNSVFVGNKGSNGGGIYNQISSNPNITNVVFNSNTATNGGGIYNNSSCSPTIINCTFNGNSATTNGAGVYNNSSSNPIIKNSIIWGNTGGGTQGIYNASSTPTVTYTIVQGTSVYSGTGNLLSDPLFLNTSDPDGTDNIWRTADDGLSIQRSSPAINAGTNTGAPSTDITDSTRISTADMGAYENVSNNANLSSLVISEGTLSPVFTSDSLRYTATVTNASSTITVTPTVAESSAVVTVKVNSGSYATVTSGSPSAALVLNEGVNTINIKVTAQDGTTTKIDTITVCRSVTPSVSIAVTAGSATICTGNSVTFTASPTNGGTPTYQWKKGSINIDGETNATYTSTSLADNDSIKVVMTSTASCRTNDTAISNAIKMTVNSVCTFTWTGATSSDWTTPTNWTPNGVPASTDDVIIPSTINEPMLPSGQIIQNLNLTGANKIMLGNNNLCVNSITGGSSTAYVVIDGTGSLTVKSLSTSAPTVFPIGMSETSYDSLSIQPSNSADFTVKVKNTPTAGDFSGSIANFSKVVHRQWEITPSGGSPGSTVLTFTNGGTALVPTTPVVGHFTSSNVWEELPATYHDGVWTATTTSFSPFSVGQAGGFVPSTLPIELLSFKAENSGTDNILRWSTATEQNSQYFEIQHTLNGIDFKKMDRITAAGESSMTKNYNYTHLNPASTTHYYRLKMVDKDGTFKYSLIESVNNLDNNSIEPISLYPNPTKGNLTIAALDYTHAMHLYNANGKLVASSNTTPNEIDMSKLPVGVYFLHIGKDVLKVIKQ